MKKIILLSAVTVLLSSCGIYSKYKPETAVPDNLYEEGIETADTAGIGDRSEVAGPYRTVTTEQY